MLELYRNIKRLRIEKEMTQSELAEKIGYSDKGMISKIENGLVDLPQSKIEEFAEIFSVTPSYLMGWEEKEPPSPSRPSFFLSDEEKEIIRKLREISDDDRASVLNSLDFFYNRTKKESGRKEKAS